MVFVARERYSRKRAGALAAFTVAATLATAPAISAPKTKSPPANPAPPTDASRVFGVAPGVQIDSLPPCDAPEGAEHICRRDGDSRKPDRRGLLSHTIELRPDKLSFAETNLLISTKDDGAIASIYLRTKGITVEAETLEYLTRRLGKPASLERPTFRTGMGIPVQTIQALWLTPTGSVSFSSAEGRVDQGAVLVSAP